VVHTVCIAAEYRHLCSVGAHLCGSTCSSNFRPINSRRAWACSAASRSRSYPRFDNVVSSRVSITTASAYKRVAFANCLASSCLTSQQANLVVVVAAISGVYPAPNGPRRKGAMQWKGPARQPSCRPRGLAGTARVEQGIPTLRRAFASEQWIQQCHLRAGPRCVESCNDLQLGWVVRVCHWREYS
jgi:hypothetical protein